MLFKQEKYTQLKRELCACKSFKGFVFLYPLINFIIALLSITDKGFSARWAQFNSNND